MPALSEASTATLPSHVYVSSVNAFQRSYAHSFIHVPGAEDIPWFALLREPPGYVIFPPPPEPLSPRTRGDMYAWTLLADEYAEEVRAALRAGEDDQVRHALAVIHAILEVAIARSSAKRLVH
jgi:hypothetical protein